MRLSKKVLVAGLFLFGLSFALPAVNYTAPSGSEPGFTCALISLFTPWNHDNLPHFQSGLRYFLEWISLLLSGWINPLFLAAMLCSKWQRIFRTLRMVLVAMLPACWFAFYFMSLYPREGYFLWVAGMLLDLFSVDKP